MFVRTQANQPLLKSAVEERGWGAVLDKVKKVVTPKSKTDSSSQHEDTQPLLTHRPPPTASQKAKADALQETLRKAGF